MRGTTSTLSEGQWVRTHAGHVSSASNGAYVSPCFKRTYDDGSAVETRTWSIVVNSGVSGLRPPFGSGASNSR